MSGENEMNECDIQSAVKLLNRYLNDAKKTGRAPTVAVTMGDAGSVQIQLRNPYWWTNGARTENELN